MNAAEFEFTVTGDFVKVAKIRTEWQDDVEAPEEVIRVMKKSGVKADLFSFWQRVPDTSPKFDYVMEWDNWAILEVSTYEHWFRKQINLGARSAINKSKKKGVEVRVVPLSDEFIAGVSEIYNETPVRQGRTFTHYGAGSDELRKEFARDEHRTDFVAAYCGNELVGFYQQVYAGQCAHPFGGLTKIAHRDKSVNNALLSKSVELCEQKKIKYIVYGSFDYGSGVSSLADWKRYNGFQKIDLPRYYVPLTVKGKIGLKLGLHHGAKSLIPPKVREQLKDIRKTWLSRRIAASK